MAIADVAKKIYDPKRAKSIGAQNRDMLKKTGKYVAKKGKPVVKKLAKGFAPVAAASVAGETLRRQGSMTPEQTQQRGGADVSTGLSLLESTAGGLEDVVNFATSPVRALTGTPEGRPLTETVIPSVRAGSYALGGQLANIVGGRDIDTEQSVRAYQTELGKYQQEGVAPEQVDLTGVGTPVGSGVNTVPEGVDQTGAELPVTDTQYAGQPITLREGQTDEGFVRRIDDTKGGFGTLTTEQQTTTDSPETVESALAGIEGRQDIRFTNAERIRQEQQAASTEGQRDSQIKQLEEQLAQPGRGLRQSFGDLLTEQQGRKTARKQLDALYKSRDVATTQAGQTERAALVSQDKARDRGLRYRELVGKQGAAATKERNALRKEATEVYEADAKARFPDSPSDQAFAVAQNLETHLPGSSFDTPQGRIARRDAMEVLVKTGFQERGLIDWFAKFGGSSKPQTYTDMAKIDFSDWNVDKGEIVLPEWITSNDAYRNKDGNYAYFDNMPPKIVWLIKQLITSDKQKKTGIRRGQ